MRKSKATEALRVAQEIAVIRTVLKKRGYRMRKRPKQAVWIIYVTNNSFYQLTYQPAPISSWVLHPQNNDSERHCIEALIQRTLLKQSISIARRVS